MNSFTIHISPFTMLSPFTFHHEIAHKGKWIMDKARKKVNGKMIIEATEGSVL